LNKRIQLTLFLTEPEATAIEKIRQQYNPVQSALIKSHVTLCREQELISLEPVLDRLQNLSRNPLVFKPGPLVRTEEGRGVYLSLEENDNGFRELRAHVLQNKNTDLKPHITLIHPRNGTCNDGIFKRIEEIGFPDLFQLNTISLIEQETAYTGIWRTLAEFPIQYR
jgi:hypothetical protein